MSWHINAAGTASDLKAIYKDDNNIPSSVKALMDERIDVVAAVLDRQPKPGPGGYKQGIHLKCSGHFDGPSTSYASTQGCQLEVSTILMGRIPKDDAPTIDPLMGAGHA